MATKPQKPTSKGERAYGVYFTCGSKVELESLHETPEDAVKAREALLRHERKYWSDGTYDPWFGEGDPSGKN